MTDRVQQWRRVARGHELLEPVPDQKEPGNDPEHEESGVHRRPPIAGLLGFDRRPPPRDDNNTGRSRDRPSARTRSWFGCPPGRAPTIPARPKGRRDWLSAALAAVAQVRQDGEHPPVP